VSLVYTGMLLPGAKFLSVASSLPELCSPAILRSVNVGLALVCSLLFFNIVRHLEPKKSEKNALWKAFLLSLYPLHWFFVFLYYTGEFSKQCSFVWCFTVHACYVMAIL
jgi:alpha-1,2-glucosyltransferase